MYRAQRLNFLLPGLGDMMGGHPLLGIVCMAIWLVGVALFFYNLYFLPIPAGWAVFCAVTTPTAPECASAAPAKPEDACGENASPQAKPGPAEASACDWEKL